MADIEILDSVRVLVIAPESSPLHNLAGELDRIGWKTLTASDGYAAQIALTDLRIEVALVDFDAAGADVFFGRRLKACCAPRRLPVIGVGRLHEAADAAAFDLILSEPLNAAQVALRLEQLSRAAVTEEEFELRQATFADNGFELVIPAPEGVARVLAVGEPSPHFLGLSHALSEAGADVIAAFTSYTAFDYLHEKPFDCVVLWGASDVREALSIASGMRRNTRLHHIPTLLYLHKTEQVAYEDAFHRGVTDIAAPDSPVAETARRVIALCRAYQRQSAVRQALESARQSGLIERATGLFPRDLFAKHLGRLAGACQARKRALSVCVLRIQDSPDTLRARAKGMLERALPQVGGMISRLVRAEDTAARLSSDVFALALPATSASAARIVAERINAVIGCTAFDAAPGQPPFVLGFDVGVAELIPGEAPAVALERAAKQALPSQRVTG